VPVSVKPVASGLAAVASVAAWACAVWVKLANVSTAPNAQAAMAGLIGFTISLLDGSGLSANASRLNGQQGIANGSD